MNDISLVPRALEFYDGGHEKIKMLNRLAESAVPNIIFYQGDLGRSKIEFTDKEKNILLTSEFEYIGIYYPKMKVWSWPWAVPGTNKNDTYLSRKILEYGLDISSDVLLGLKMELITSRFFVTDAVQVDIHLAVSAYLLKNPYIYQHVIRVDEDSDNYFIYFLILLNKDAIDILTV